MAAPRSLARLKARCIASAAAALLAVGLACGESDRAASPAEALPRPHLIFISIDTLRADTLKPWRGSLAALAPNLDRFATEAVVVEQGFVPMPFTLPSHMSMLTGVYPGVHRVDSARAVLSRKLATLAELLEAEGYRTGAWVANDWLDKGFGFGRGFEEYVLLREQLSYAARIDSRVLEFVEEVEGAGDRFFLFIHYMDPHSDTDRRTDNELPYYSSPEFRRDLSIHEGEFCTEGRKCATNYLLAVDERAEALSPAQVAKIRGLYEAGVRQLDYELGRLFGRLRELGVYDESLIVITSDHGEEFREHGLFIHSQVYDETIAVPLMFRLPGALHAGRRVPGLSQVIDILPTVLDYLGLEAPTYLQGRNLLAALETDDSVALPSSPILSQDKIVRSLFALRTSHYKLVHDFSNQTSQLYHLTTDPAEQRDISGQQPERVAEMLTQLRALRQRNSELGEALAETESLGREVLSSEAKEALKHIGYLDASEDSE